MRRREQQQLAEAIIWALRYREVRLLLIAAALLALGIWIVAGCPGLLPPHHSPQPPADPSSVPSDPDGRDAPPTPPGQPAGPGRYQLCFWNVENLFDDRNDKRTGPGDREYDEWYANDPRALEAKLDHLTAVLLPLNDGKAPDILCVAEIESARAAELLLRALNQQLDDRKLHYSTVVYNDPAGGRNIGTAIITRLPVQTNRTTLLGQRQRILEGQIRVADRPLTIIASHWSSRISDKTGATRSRYGDVIHERFLRTQRADPAFDFLVCGDFNDNPDDPSVTQHLRAVTDRSLLRDPNSQGLLFNLTARLWKDGQATHFYGSTPYLFDQICVSPGLLDNDGWTALPDSVRIIPKMATRFGKPNRFGGANDRRPFSSRGASDHFPVVIDLDVR